jgi:LPXTG-motif cell wall-anchored protein
MAFVALGEALAGAVSSTIVSANVTKATQYGTEAERIKAQSSKSMMMALLAIAVIIAGTVLMIFKRKKK